MLVLSQRSGSVSRVCFVLRSEGDRPGGRECGDGFRYAFVIEETFP